jgi:hypothetical protein
MTRGQVIGIPVAFVLAYAVVGTRVAVGQLGLNIPGASIALPSVAGPGITIASTSVGLSGSGATVVLPGVSVANLAIVTSSSVSVSGAGASVVLPGASVANIATVSTTSLNITSTGATVALPSATVLGVDVTSTPLSLDLTGSGNLLELPAVHIGVGSLEVTLLGDDGLENVLNQLSSTTQMFAGFGRASIMAPFEQVLDGMAFDASSACTNADASGFAPAPAANVWTWNAVTVGTTDHSGYELHGGGNGAGCSLPFHSLERSQLPGMIWDASSYFGLKPGTLHLGFTGGVTETDTQIRASRALLDAGIAQAGAARLTSTMVGGYSLLRSGNWYAGSAFGSAWGRNESRDFVLGAASEYDTSTFIAAGILGNIVPINDNLRFDVRGTLAYQRTVGDSHVDSLGIAYGNHTIETANATLSGRLFGLLRQGALTIRPYLQAGIVQRLHYDNEVEIDGIGFTFEEADTSVFAATGVDLDIDRSLQLSAGVRHEHSSDFDNLTARFGVVLKLN